MLYIITSKNGNGSASNELNETGEKTFYEFKYSALLPATTCKLIHDQPLSYTHKCVSMHYVQELAALVIAFSDGTVVTYKRQDDGKLILFIFYFNFR